MKISTRAFLLGLLPTLLVAVVLTAYHLHTRLGDLDDKLTQQGAAMARHLASSAEYGVFSGNKAVLAGLLDQVTAEPGVASAALVWPDHARLSRGEPVGDLPKFGGASQWQEGHRAWFVYPVQLRPLDGGDPFIEPRAATAEPLAWAAVSVDLQQKEALAQELLLASLGITLVGLVLAILLIYSLALTGVRPLLDIIAVVRRVSLGSFGTRMDVTAHSPELRELQTMVNRMSESLYSYQQDMEARVCAMTAELEQKRREAEQANLAKSRFLAAASHDLRQPMHAISLYVESLKLQLPCGTAQDTLSKIERAILGTVELFNAILDVTKLDAGVVQPDLVPLRVRVLLHQLAEEFSVEADAKGLSLRVRSPDIWITSDAVLLERILRNLLSNALRHTERGGVLVSARRCQGRLRLQVWDTGSGIAPEIQPRVFEEFYQGESGKARTRHGLGLGLAIVRRLAKLLGYPLQMHSRPGQGTVFSLDAPLLGDAAAHGAAAQGAQAGDFSGRVVVVDDDPVILNALGDLLRQWKIEVQPLRTLAEIVHELRAAPDLVLADYQLLNGETGVMVAREVHARWGTQVPVVLITGDTRTETIQALREEGFPVLHKPVRADQLRALLASLLRGRPGTDGSGEITSRSSA